jgi:methionine-S-sulfoxide reductase
MEKILLGGGCFWGVEYTLGKISGVRKTTAGYSGGHINSPSYEQVCSGTTGHAEVVEVLFDPNLVNLNTILQAYFNLHDPTQVNRQGVDIGTQYRSCIYYCNNDQKQTIDDVLKAESDARDEPLATEVRFDQKFWPAEEYHQCYLAKRND